MLKRWGTKWSLGLCCGSGAGGKLIEDFRQVSNNQWKTNRKELMTDFVCDAFHVLEDLQKIRGRRRGNGQNSKIQDYMGMSRENSLLGLDHLEELPKTTGKTTDQHFSNWGPQSWLIKPASWVSISMFVYHCVRASTILWNFYFVKLLVYKQKYWGSQSRSVKPLWLRGENGHVLAG